MSRSSESIREVLVNLDGGEFPCDSQCTRVTPDNRAEIITEMKRRGHRRYAIPGVHPEVRFAIYGATGNLTPQMVEYWYTAHGRIGKVVGLVYALGDWGDFSDIPSGD